MIIFNINQNTPLAVQIGQHFNESRPIELFGTTLNILSVKVRAFDVRVELEAHDGN